jgi:hypothetical protein
MGFRGPADQFTVNVVDPEIPLRVALIVTFPEALAVARPPPLTPLLIVATLEEDVLQWAEALTSCVVPSA